jgi:uncharacterized protein YfaS (alpha-2-macroglobulin family)
MGDAVERTVRVKPDGKPVVQTINGRLEENLTQEFSIPVQAIQGASDLVVKIYPGSFSQVVEGMDSIFRMPYGCFEQTSSTTYPNVLVLDYMRRTNQIKPKIEMKALNFVNLGYQRLLSFEVRGGGFEWYGKAPAHTVLTAYGLMEFTDMAKVYDIDPAVIERTRNWLYSKQKNNGSWDLTGRRFYGVRTNQSQVQNLSITAYIAWAIGESGRMDTSLSKAMGYINDNASQAKDAYTLAVCANAIIAGKRFNAKHILDRLDSLKKQDKDLVYWNSAGEGVTYSRGNVLDIEATALTAYAYIKANYKVDVAQKALNWLIEQKDPAGTWHSTQATVLAMRALLCATGPLSAVEDTMHVAVTANGKLGKEIEITKETSDVFRLISLRQLVKAGSNKVTLEAAGKGSLAYQIVATHYMPWRTRDQKPGQKEITIDVAYDSTHLRKDDILTAKVKVEYNRPGTANMTIIDLGIPPGFQVLPDAFETMKEKGQIERYSVTGRQVILYIRQIKNGVPLTFEYKMKAKFPVKVKTPSSSVYQYYEPDVRDATKPVEIIVI